jgi:hypothetical protein
MKKLTKSMFYNILLAYFFKTVITLLTYKYFGGHGLQPDEFNLVSELMEFYKLRKILTPNNSKLIEKINNDLKLSENLKENFLKKEDVLNNISDLKKTVLETSCDFPGFSLLFGDNFSLKD